MLDENLREALGEWLTLSVLRPFHLGNEEDDTERLCHQQNTNPCAQTKAEGSVSSIGGGGCSPLTPASWGVEPGQHPHSLPKASFQHQLGHWSPRRRERAPHRVHSAARADLDNAAAAGLCFFNVSLPWPFWLYFHSTFPMFASA